MCNNVCNREGYMKKIQLEAKVENLQTVLDLIDDELDNAGCPMKVKMQIDIAVEELFVNVANYAYAPGTGEATVIIDVEPSPGKAVITIKDGGIPFDPTSKEDPDVTLSAAERRIGGLGIYMAKKSMDSMEYAYKDGCNIVTITKNI